jgi:hypothetical protein
MNILKNKVIYKLETNENLKAIRFLILLIALSIPNPFERFDKWD